MKEFEQEIIDKIKEIEARESFKEILIVFKGVPISQLIEEIGGSLEEEREPITQLIKEGRIKIFGVLYNSLLQKEKEILGDFLKKWFLFIVVASAPNN